MKFSIKDFFSKCDQISRKLRIWSHLLKKSFMENFTLWDIGTAYCYGKNKQRYQTDDILEFCIYPEIFCNKNVLRNFDKFTGKHLCWSFFFNKVATSVAGCRFSACNFIKKETLAQTFSCEFCKIFKNTFFYRKPLWLLLLLH